MIPARKSRLFAWWFARDARARIERAFSAIRARGLGELARALEEGPVLVVSNHTSWWDPMVLVHLCTNVLGADAYAMMKAENLERLPFFAKVGAFGVRVEDPADGAAAIRYAAKLLDRPGRLVWIFPQGREVPITRRPLGFQPGAAQIARVARKARVIVAAVRYEHGARPEPELWLSFAPLAERPRDAGELGARMEADVAAAMDGIDAAVGGPAPEFDALYTKPESRLFALAQAALGWLTRPRLPAGR